MSDSVTVRQACDRDLPAIVDIESRSHLWRDPDFGVVCVSPHAWSREDVVAASNAPRSAAFVVADGDGNVAAYFVVEAEPEGYLLRRLTVRPQCRDGGLGRAVLYNLYRRAKKSERRKTLRAVVREDDVKTCRWLAHMGLYSRLVRKGWDEDLDAVEFYFTVTAREGKGQGVGSEQNEEG